MLIQGKTVDEKPILPNTIYVIRKSREVQFVESQKNDENDTIIISFNLDENQYGVFAKEYRPGFINKNRCKKSDIPCLVIDEQNQKLSSWIFDVKVTVGGEDVIFKLLEQLCSSYKHKNSLVAYFGEFEEYEHFGFITRDYQRERIENAISKREEFIATETQNLEKISSSVRYSIQRQIIKSKQEVEVLKRFLSGYMEINEQLYALECYYSINNGLDNCCNLKVSV